MEVFLALSGIKKGCHAHYRTIVVSNDHDLVNPSVCRILQLMCSYKLHYPQSLKKSRQLYFVI